MSTHKDKPIIPALSSLFCYLTSDTEAIFGANYVPWIFLFYFILFKIGK